MTRPHTDRFYVNLSASQVRKRIKGHGFGVKKVEATGDHQSVIVHTATGGHLRKLESLFFDVMPPPPTREPLDAESNRYGGRDDSGTAPDC
jgi:hypothetical protein